jgi:hypothetical protein
MAMACGTHEYTEKITTRKTERKKPLDDPRIRYALILTRVKVKVGNPETGPGGPIG